MISLTCFLDGWASKNIHPPHVAMRSKEKSGWNGLTGLGLKLNASTKLGSISTKDSHFLVDLSIFAFFGSHLLGGSPLISGL